MSTSNSRNSIGVQLRLLILSVIYSSRECRVRSDAAHIYRYLKWHYADLTWKFFNFSMTWRESFSDSYLLSFVLFICCQSSRFVKTSQKLVKIFNMVITIQTEGFKLLFTFIYRFIHTKQRRHMHYKELLIINSMFIDRIPSSSSLQL